MSTSKLEIGPLSFSHVVQRIALSEQKNLEVLKTTRSDRNYIVDSAEGSQRAQIHFLFTGLDEINLGARALIALFRCCPIVSVNNELLSTAWSRASRYNKYKGNFTSYSDYIPVALEDISIQTVQDMPYSISMVLTIQRIDADYISGGDLLYQGERREVKTENPQDAYWLKKWVSHLLNDTNIIPRLSEGDFDIIQLKSYAKTIVGTDIVRNEITGVETDRGAISLTYKVGDYSGSTKVLSQSCRITNHFAYHRLIGKGVPTCQHMGISSRITSLDLLFDSNDGSDFSNFCKFKEEADEIIRATNRFDRINGWYLFSPLTKLLTVRKRLPGDNIDSGGVYVPFSIDIETTDQPGLKLVKMDLAENDVSYFLSSETTIEGGRDYNELEKFLLEIVAPGESRFRDQVATSSVSSALSLVGQGDDSITSDAEMYRLFWPVGQNSFSFSSAEILGLLNVDTIRAVFINSKIDPDGSLRRSLADNYIIAGKVQTPPSGISVLQKIRFNVRTLQGTLFGIDADPNIVADLERKINEHFNVPVGENTVGRKIAEYLFIGYAGDANGFIDFRSNTGKAIELLIRNNLKFSRRFLEALFDVIAKRTKAPPDTPHLYNTDGLHAAFFKLSTYYLLYIDTHKDLTTHKITEPTSITVFQDLLLPTYGQLFGDEWESFAPTYDDIGKINWIDPRVDDIDTRSLAQAAPVVSIGDTVEPHIWFYNERKKNELREALDTGKSFAESTLHNFTLSLPFNTDEIADVEQILAERNGKVSRASPSVSADTLPGIIKKALLRHKIRNPDAFETDMRALRVAFSDQYTDKFTGKEGRINIYVNNADNVAVPYRVTSPGLGGEIYRIAKEAKLLERTLIGNSSADAEYSSVGDTQEATFDRHLSDNIEKAVKSNIDQISDDRYSAARMFPGIKIYLVEKRGNDIIADDSLFSVNSIISVDITKDKDDADLAVIKLADPLYILQNSKFTSGNVITVKDQKLSTNDARIDKQVVLGSARDENESELQKYKIIQGRSIQIRMGYTSMPKNMEVVFTGRITEIVPGDVLTIVAQGWKAELINRQVSFYNDNPTNRGAKDLAVMAIQKAGPDGFGQHFPQYSANFLLQHLSRLDAQELFSQIQTVQSDTDTETGSRNVVSKIVNYLNNLVGARSTDKENVGLDTRLKNIWYPDTIKFNNLYGLGRLFGTVPAFTNDGWVIPLQPAWDVLKEASRHAWNCIVQVVPYDADATIFFGHPDQPYYYTRGEMAAKTRWRKYINKLAAKTRQSIIDIQKAYEGSNYYLSTDIRRDLIATYSSYGLAFSEDALTSGISSVLSVCSGFNAYKRLKSESPGGARLDKDTLPYEAYVSLRDQFGNNLPVILLEMFFGIDRMVISRYWGSIANDFEVFLLPRYINEELNVTRENNIAVIKSRLGNSIPAKSTAEVLREIQDKIKTIDYHLSDLPNDPYRHTYTGLNVYDEVIRDIGKLVDFNANKLSSAIGILRESKEYLVEVRTSLVGDRPVGRWYNASISQKISEAVNLLFSAYNIIGEVIAYSIEGESVSETRVITQDTLIDALDDDKVLDQLKAYIYFFRLYLSESADGRNLLGSTVSAPNPLLPPTMKTFRVHHYVDSKSDIIQNNIVATTSEMWNTVVIEHPAQGEASNVVSSSSDIIQKGQFYSAVKWQYYPSKEITGVIGLQFHPGMTLANKKVRVFTELNSITPELSAKIACTHLADGVRRMYRGTLIVKGRNMKPHDRVLIDDEYTQMSGMVEIESLIHHWNPSQGWITNIVPQAICDANPGAAIIQTGLMQAAYERVYNIIGLVSDALTVGLLVGTLGGGSIALGSGNVVRTGLTQLFLNARNGGLPLVYRTVFRRAGQVTGSLGSAAYTMIKGNPIRALQQLWRSTGGLATSHFKNITLIGLADQLTYLSYRQNVITAFAEHSNEVAQLPVILSPLLQNGLPFTAGLETDDAMFTIYTNGLYYSSREFMLQAGRVVDELFGTDKVSLK